ncbi:hypothetical protein CORC01_02712 [Colletotrichum orchidophilum]|uniref:DUF7730 domain-containing protein n=1 Tax=Colletotrichum orchidophilum TaxID=1209926 RepID=A0A1G4BLG6_9PEZI|nr:uncharacterized protein CORC01_02712 [Colletotrichum orchidophilum]OHF02133.1 hypothetical protein CORC01_02712 [Colletotrichum orchidophilum]
MSEREDDCRVTRSVETEAADADKPQTAASNPAGQLQSQSSFFSALPLEIRQNIYSHLWQATGSTQHVYRSGPSTLAPLSHCQCIADLDAEDNREVELTRVLNTPPAAPSTTEGGVGPDSAEEMDAINNWRFRLVSSWCNHWTCEEEPPVLREFGQLSLEDEAEEEKAKDGSKGKKRQLLVKEFSPFLAVLLTCKRMHEEAMDSIYNDTTFSLINTDAFSRFLQTTTVRSLSRIKRLHFTWRAPIETYMEPEAEDVIAERIKWNEVWMDAASKLPRLKELRIWAYPYYARFPTPFEEWFEPLHQFGRVPVFHVSLRWFQNPPTPDTGPLDFLEAAPFEYDRIPPCEENPLHFHWRRLIGLGPDEPRVPITRRQKKKRRYLGRAL